MASIREVAKLSNVASATVSRYLNGTTLVSDDKRERIENAMRELRKNCVSVAIV